MSKETCALIPLSQKQWVSEWFLAGCGQWLSCACREGRLAAADCFAAPSPQLCTAAAGDANVLICTTGASDARDPLGPFNVSRRFGGGYLGAL